MRKSATTAEACDEAPSAPARAVVVSNVFTKLALLIGISLRLEHPCWGDRAPAVARVPPAAAAKRHRSVWLAQVLRLRGFYPGPSAPRAGRRPPPAPARRLNIW